jgi:hypothetical protein
MGFAYKYNEAADKAAKANQLNITMNSTADENATALLESAIMACSQDMSSQQCLACIRSSKTNFCRYQKTFTYYQCCSTKDTEGVCASDDEDVLCSKRDDTAMKYFLCP